MLVTALKGLKVMDVACGSGDAQTLAVTENGKKKEKNIISASKNRFFLMRRLSAHDIAGQVWSWGDGDYGKLGRGGSDGCKTPKLVEKLQDLDIVKVCCGSQFSVALTKDGQVYTWGKGDNQRLGHGTDEHVRYPKLLDSLQGEFRLLLHCLSSFVLLYCTCLHLFFISDFKSKHSCVTCFIRQMQSKILEKKLREKKIYRLKAAFTVSAAVSLNPQPPPPPKTHIGYRPHPSHTAGTVIHTNGRALNNSWWEQPTEDHPH